MDDYLYLKRNLLILAAIERYGECSKTKIGKMLDATWTHVTMTIRKYLNEGLIEEEKRGRETIVWITPKGKTFLGLMRKGYEFMDEAIKI